MKITWLGHAGIKIVDQGKILYIDPWLTGNPVAKLKVEDIKKADAVFVTHGHGDHGYDDAVKICKNTGATFISVFELANKAQSEGVKNVIGGNIGGTASVAGFEFIFTVAHHSTTIGVPLGFVIKLSTLAAYHAGDTGLFMDMKLLGDLYDIDLAFLPIGSLYTMGPKEAAKALELLNCSKVVPIHYKTFPVLLQDVQKFIDVVGPMVDVIALEPGEEREI
ncbi:MAG: metal-dependent hydrolase [Candidatus Heimdallarchaeota archaeon]|nr:metal-dependent hydrolase [Candidatus Heimdallarchaeota archaeon]